VSDIPPLLDPRDGDCRRRRALDAWLRLQRAGALRPEDATRALEAAGGDPARAAALLGRDRRAARLARAARAGRGAGARAPGIAEGVERPGGGRPQPAACTADELPLDPSRCRERLARWGARALPLGSPLYPERLRRLADPAPLLLVRGDPGALSAPAVAVVGSRRATAAGREAARRLARELASAGLAVVSGLARGIDAAAHEGALEEGGVGVAVLGCGIDRIYPRGHEDLAERLLARGAVVSELPPGAPPLPHHFPLRNRLIAGLASAVVVVEARERSGSLSTARHALEQGAELLAVPGPTRSPAHRGSNLLLREGAWVCLDAEDVRRALGMPPREVPWPDPEADTAPHSQRAILAALREEPATPDELSRRLERPAEAIAADLVHLELAGRVAREADGRLVVKA